jgi:membrane fusion protein (multidrug efflux system)
MATIQIGNLVSPSTALTTVSQVDPIRAYFPITEQEYLKVARLSNPGRGGDWIKAASATPLKLVLADGTTYAHTGRIYFTDRQVDPKTGTIRVVATFPNPGNILRPGQFGRVQAVTETLRGAVLIPQRAVSEIQGRHQIAVVGSDNRVALRNVEVGPRVGTMWVIASGLRPGEQVIIEGLAKAADGTRVAPKAAPVPGASVPAKGI